MVEESTVNDCVEKVLLYGKIKLFYYIVIISC